eukprot:12121098-Alexandrium_andersonii.AAC.1
MPPVRYLPPWCPQRACQEIKTPGKRSADDLADPDSGVKQGKGQKKKTRKSGDGNNGEGIPPKPKKEKSGLEKSLGDAMRLKALYCKTTAAAQHLVSVIPVEDSWAWANNCPNRGLLEKCLLDCQASVSGDL